MQVSCGVIFENNKLLLLKKAYGQFKGKYEFPGGKRTDYETLRECLARELLEEISCDSFIGDLIHFAHIKKEDINEEEDINLYFYDVSLLNKDIQLSDEHTNYIWVSFEDTKKINMIDWDYSFLRNIKPYCDNKRK